MAAGFAVEVAVEVVGEAAGGDAVSEHDATVRQRADATTASLPPGLFARQ